MRAEDNERPSKLNSTAAFSVVPIENASAWLDTNFSGLPLETPGAGLAIQGSGLPYKSPDDHQHSAEELSTDQFSILNLLHRFNEELNPIPAYYPHE